MKVLFIGGTGLISTASTELAIQRGIEVHLLNRGNRPLPAGAKSLVADINGDPADVARALGDHRFDAVVDWIAFGPEHVRRDVALFRDRTKQYVFISSASAYQKPVSHYLIREDTPLANPYWDYVRTHARRLRHGPGRRPAHCHEPQLMSSSRGGSPGRVLGARWMQGGTGLSG